MTFAAATKQAIEQSKNGYVQHVNKCASLGNIYYVSDWCDGSTVASYENGKKL